MKVVAEVLTASGVLVMIGLIFRWMWTRITKMEKRHCLDLFSDGHQPRYVTEEHCNDKFDELKVLIKQIDKGREETKDLFVDGQRKIENRLTAIETILDQPND